MSDTEYYIWLFFWTLMLLANMTLIILGILT